MSHATFTWPVLPADADASAALASSSSAIGLAGVDLELDDDGDLIVDSDAHLTTGMSATRQGASIRIQMFRGEWFWNLDYGVPYLPINGVAESDSLLGQKYNELKARAAFRAMLVSTPGIDRIDDLAVTFDGRTRSMSVRFRATDVDGNAITDTVEVGA
jgi:hypothetical protein